MGDKLSAGNHVPLGRVKDVTVTRDPNDRQLDYSSLAYYDKVAENIYRRVDLEPSVSLYNFPGTFIPADRAERPRDENLSPRLSIDDRGLFTDTNIGVVQKEPVKQNIKPRQRIVTPIRITRP